jgi:hypothetical protein
VIRALAAAVVGGALIVALGACGHTDSIGRTVSPASSGAVSPARSGVLTPSAATPTPDLSAISADLAGIDSATSQANSDLSAGDAARTQNDTG